MSALRHPLRGRPTLLAAVTALLLPALGACAGGDEGSPAGGALSANRVDRKSVV